MTKNASAIYSYNSSTGLTSPINFAVALPSTLIPALLLFLIKPALALIPIGILLIILLSSTINHHKIVIAPNCLIVGNKVLYYSCLTKIEINREKGVAEFYLENGKSLRIVYRNFTTNAQKPFKIENNKRAKFDKVTKKIKKKIKSTSPKVAVFVK